MKSFKKVFAIVLIGIFAVGMLSACSGGGSNQTAGNSTAPADSGSTAVPAPAGSGSSVAPAQTGSNSSDELTPEEKEEREKEQNDSANVRSAYADVMADYITEKGEYSRTVPAEQEQEGWQDENAGKITTQIDGVEKIYIFAAKTTGESYTVTVTPPGDGDSIPNVSIE